ncbi:Sec-independent protein translocase protein TatB [Prosthecomicrobium sp. N25]|uniref:Sec-independent protein translocase protein TatB n=1 Tax=Prosthecomicrobium sp. N25 TaxID=3129254 RepID=UPI003077D044
MLDVGWSELLIIGVVALVVVGPKDLPKLLRLAGQWMGKIRRMAAEFQGQVNEAIREAELEDVKKSVEDLKSYNPANMIRNEIDSALAPVTQVSNELNSEMARIEAGLDAPMTPPATADAAPAVAEPPAPSAESLGLPDLQEPQLPLDLEPPKPAPAPVPDATTPTKSA